MPATASSAAASDAPERDDLTAPSTTRTWPSTLMWAVMAVLLGSMAAVMFASHRAGHWWGDDWALYVNQARSLLDGNPGEVTAANAFTVEQSRGAAFSPPLYPWGFPLLLAPFVAIVGTDVDRLAVVPVLCAMVFALAWFDLARRRIGSLPAMVGVVAVTMTPLLLGWTELIQSEWPFLAVVAVALVGLDRLAASGALVDLRRSPWPLVAMGLGATAAFSVRREGLAVTGAIAVAQLVALAGADRSWWAEHRTRIAMTARLLVPHATALASVLLLQLVLPSTLVPQYSGTGVGNVWGFRRAHLDHLAEVAGLKRSWQESPEVLGSTALGWVAVGAYLGLALVGIVLAFVVHRRRDLHLVAYVVGAFLIGGSFRSALNRYVVTIAPLLMLLAASALFTIVRLVPWRPAAPIAVSAALGLVVAGNVVQADDRISYAQQFADAGAVEWGATHPDAVEMFDAVERLTGPDDVVGAPKARAMTLVTGRPSVQVDDYRPVPDDLPLAIVVVEPGTRIAEQLGAPESRFREVWRNARFVVYAAA